MTDLAARKPAEPMLLDVHKYAIRVPVAAGRCENCGQPVAYNLSVPICQHTEPTDCTDPFPAIEEKP